MYDCDESYGSDRRTAALVVGQLECRVELMMLVVGADDVALADATTAGRLFVYSIDLHNCPRSKKILLLLLLLLLVSSCDSVAISAWNAFQGQEFQWDGIRSLAALLRSVIFYFSRGSLTHTSNRNGRAFFSPINFSGLVLFF